MAYNLFIAYDLDKPGQNYEAVHERIKSLGDWYHAQFSLFYVRSELSPEEAHKFVFQAMDSNDKLIVVHALDAVMYPAPDAIMQFVRTAWFKAA